MPNWVRRSSRRPNRSGTPSVGSPRPRWWRSGGSRRRVDVERLPRGADPTTHTKLGRGGLSDIEWTVQLLQLRHAGAEPTLRVPSTLPADRRGAAARAAGRRRCGRAVAGWEQATRVRNAITLVRAKAEDQIPRQGRPLAAVARALGYPEGSDPGPIRRRLPAHRPARPARGGPAVRPGLSPPPSDVYGARTRPNPAGPARTRANQRRRSMSLAARGGGGGLRSGIIVGWLRGSGSSLPSSSSSPSRSASGCPGRARTASR